jgi:hypothetical protein
MTSAPNGRWRIWTVSVLHSSESLALSSPTAGPLRLSKISATILPERPMAVFGQMTRIRSMIGCDGIRSPD